VTRERRGRRRTAATAARYLEGSSSDDLAAAARVWRMGAALGGRKDAREWVAARADSDPVSMAAEGPSMTGAACTRRRRAGRHGRPLHSRSDRMMTWNDGFAPGGHAKPRGSHRVLLFV
jgi:hypothetical protein